MTTYVVIERCGEDWYLSLVEPSRYTYEKGNFIDSETGRRWAGNNAFADYLKSRA